MKHAALYFPRVGPIFALSVALSLGAACGGSTSDPATSADGEVIKTGDGKVVSAAAANAFKEGVAAMQAHDKANDWTDDNCKSTAEAFTKANSEQKGTFFEALYNAGVAHQRCKQDKEAKAMFEKILGEKSDFHRARTQLALYEYAESKDIEKAIGDMKQAIADAQFKNEEALVNLAILQMARDGATGDSGCESDFECAKLNLQRALAINDSFMPAFNQLAVYYLQSAQKKAGRTKGAVKAAAGDQKKADSAALELAALVCSQALRKNANYAPVHNTSGLISAELGDLSAAARAFATARQLDKKFFEAHMNYAAVNLQFRGFAQAEEAYRQALAMNPNDYEAVLGLALAVRGQINDSNFDKNLKESDTLLDKAKSLQPNRAETYYNQAILTQEFKARGGTAAEKMLGAAKDLFGQFKDKAAGQGQFDAAVKVATERMAEIDQILEFNRQSKEEQKRMDAERKAQEAKEQLEKKQGGGAKKP